MPWSEAYRDQLVTSSLRRASDGVALDRLGDDLYRRCLDALNDYVAKDPDVGPRR